MNSARVFLISSMLSILAATFSCTSRDVDEWNALTGVEKRLAPTDVCLGGITRDQTQRRAPVLGSVACDGSGERRVWIAASDELGNLEPPRSHSLSQAFQAAKSISLNILTDNLHACTGIVRAGGAYDLLVELYAGEELKWTRVVPGKAWLGHYDATLAEDGGIVVAGRTPVTKRAHPLNYYDAMAVKYGAGGQEEWVRSWRGPEEILSIAKSGRGFVVAGHSYPTGSRHIAAYVGFLGEDGALGKELSFPNPTGESYAVDCVANRRGEIFVLINEESILEDYAARVVKLLPSGDVVWNQRIVDTPKSMMARGLGVTPEGNIVFTGDYILDSFVAVADGSDGAVMWRGTFGRPGIDGGTCVAPTGSGRWLVGFVGTTGDDVCGLVMVMDAP